MATDNGLEQMDSLPGMQELEPSPVEDTPIDAEKDSYFPPPQAPRHSTTLLGLNDRSITWWCMVLSPSSLSGRADVDGQ